MQTSHRLVFPASIYLAPLGDVGRKIVIVPSLQLVNFKFLALLRVEDDGFFSPNDPE